MYWTKINVRKKKKKLVLRSFQESLEKKGEKLACCKDHLYLLPTREDEMRL